MNVSKFNYRIIVDGKLRQIHSTKTEAMLAAAYIFRWEDGVKTITIEKFEI